MAALPRKNSQTGVGSQKKHHTVVRAARHKGSQAQEARQRESTKLLAGPCGELEESLKKRHHAAAACKEQLPESGTACFCLRLLAATRASIKLPLKSYLRRALLTLLALLALRWPSPSPSLRWKQPHVFAPVLQTASEVLTALLTVP